METSWVLTLASSSQRNNGTPRSSSAQSLCVFQNIHVNTLLSYTVGSIPSLMNSYASSIKRHFLNIPSPSSYFFIDKCLLINLFNTIIIVCIEEMQVCMDIHAMDYMWRSEAKSVQSFLSFHLYMGSGDQTGVIRLTRKHLCLPPSLQPDKHPF